MNKNTLIGLLLMGVVIMVFSWINQPTPEQRAAQEKAKQEQQATENKKSEAPAASISAMPQADVEAIRATIRRDGVFDDSTRLYTLSGKNAVLTLGADSAATVGGYVTVGQTRVPAADIMTATYTGIDNTTAAEALNTLRTAVDNAARYRGMARFMTGNDSASVTLQNDVLRLTLSSKGGVIAQAELLDPKYSKYGGGQVCPITAGDDMYGFRLQSGDALYDTRDLYFEMIQESDTSVVMQVQPGAGTMFGIRYTLAKGSDYTVGMQFIQKNANAIIPGSVSSMEFNWNQTMARNEAGRVFESDNSALYYMAANGDVDNLSERSDDSEDVKNPLTWVAFKNQFFSTVLIAHEGFNKASLSSEVIPEKENSDFVKKMSMESRLDYRSDLATPASFTFYIGPNLYPTLNDLSETIIPDTDLHLTKLIPLGWSLFRWINTWIIIPVFTFLGKYIANYGIIILLLTIFIKILLYPFTYKSYMSQAKMRVLAPEVKEINEKYAGQENAMKRQQETMALYSRAGANPMSGCLPMLLQLPILIAMFRFFPSAIELRGESFLWATDLSAPDAIIPLPFTVPYLGNHLSLFCLLMTIVNIVYTRINMQNQPGGAQSPMMKWMMYLMPVMFLAFFNQYAAALSYYYLLSLLITIIQTYIFRKVVSEEKVRATMKANAAKPKKKSGLMARLEEAQRKQQQMLREQQEQQRKRSNRR